MDGRCKIPPESDQYWHYTTCHRKIFRGEDQVTHSYNTKLRAHTYVRYLTYRMDCAMAYSPPCKSGER